MGRMGGEEKVARALVKPRQAESQGKRNVHFMPTGSAVMARQVAAAIREHLRLSDEPPAGKTDPTTGKALK